MEQKDKVEILLKFKEWFRNTIIENHIKNTVKLENVEEFNINPFLLYYLANYLEGNSSATALAKVLIYPRVLGTSISTSFGANVQQFVTKVLSGYGSTTHGIDIEYTDSFDNRRKYCQLKSGPNAINRDDVKTISDHFNGIKHLARTNNLQLQQNDLVFALSYGERSEINSFIHELESKFVTVLVGREFWTHFTGDTNFYFDLIKAAGDIANEVDMKEMVDDVVLKLSDNIEKRFNNLYKS